MFPAFFLFASKGCGVGGEGRGEDFSCWQLCNRRYRCCAKHRPGQGGDASWPEMFLSSPLLCIVLAVEMCLIPCPCWQPVGSGVSSCARLGAPWEEMLLQRGF